MVTHNGVGNSNAAAKSKVAVRSSPYEVPYSHCSTNKDTLGCRRLW